MKGESMEFDMNTIKSSELKAMTLNKRLLVAMLFLAAVTIGVFSVTLYLEKRNTLMDGMDEKLRIAAFMARATLPADFHDRLSGPESISDAEYQLIVDRYNNLCTTLGMEYLWSLMDVNGTIVFTTATSPDKDAKNRKHAAFFEKHSNPELYIATFASMKPSYQINDDKWGRIRVALVPFKDTKGRPYLFGASIRMTEVDRQLHQIVYTSILISLILLAGTFGVGTLLARTMTGPIRKLTETIKDVAEGNAEMIAEEQGSYEQIVLARSFNRLNRALQDKIVKLKLSEETLLQSKEVLLDQNDELLATEEMLRTQVGEYQITHDHLLATEEMLRVQLDVVEESSQKFRAVFEHSPIAVALTNQPEGSFSEINQEFIDLFGYSREEAIGKTSMELGVWLNEADRNRYRQQLVNNGFVHNFEVDMRRKDGDVFTVLFSSSMLDIAGKSLALSALIDISEQKRLQKQLQQTQKMDVIGQLAGGIAHDFNNMLTGIMAAAELLKMRLSNDEKKHKMVDIIIEATTRSADLTRELLTFSRKETAVSTPVSLHDTIAHVIKLLERTIDKQIQLSARLEANNPVVMGDQTQLQNALLNLGINARDAMPDGGTLTYSTTVKILDEAACRSMGISLPTAAYLEIAVSDTGVGMTKTVMEHIFEPFFTTKEVGKGTGLGLAAVYGTVRSHQGELQVLSEPGVGSVFKIYLPMIEEEAVRSIYAGETVTGSGGILLVDDEEILLDVGRDLLENLGYTVYMAENGVQALEVFAAHRSEISLVMLDMIMPKMGGKETFQRLRELDPGIKVMFCSGFHKDWTEDKLLQLGASTFIQKPYNRSELSRAVAKALAL